MDVRKRITRKIDFRILPFLWVLYLFNFLDRVNIGNVHTSFKEDLGLTETEYTLGIGIFFVGYVIFEIPSNLMLKRATPSRWISRIIFSWGVISTCMAFVNTFASYMICRFLLGVMEAGFFPGIIFYLTFWYKKEEQAFRQSLFYSAATVAGGVAGLLAYGLLQLDGKGGLAGWQWVFIIEGIPSIILGIITWFVLPDFPSTCTFLDESEKKILIESLPKDTQESHFSKKEFIDTLSDVKIWLFSLIYFCVASVSYSIVFFLPALIEDFGNDPLISNLLTVPVYIVSTISTISFAYHSDLKKERPIHLFVATLTSLSGFIMVAVFPEYDMNKLAYGACCLAGIGVFPSVLLTLSWLTNSLVGSTASATATALVICIGNIGAFLIPQLFALSYNRNESYATAFIFVASLQAFGSCAVLLLHYLQKRDKKTEELDRLLNETNNYLSD